MHLAIEQSINQSINHSFHHAFVCVYNNVTETTCIEKKKEEKTIANIRIK